MPLAGRNNLDELIAQQRLLQEEVARQQASFDECDAAGDEARTYLLDIQIRALQEEATRLASRISDILDRDLQR